MESWINQLPMRRLIGPAEIGEVVACLFFDAASAITGHVPAADADHLVNKRAASGEFGPPNRFTSEILDRVMITIR